MKKITIILLLLLLPTFALAADPFYNSRGVEMTVPATSAAAITPSDTVALPYVCRKVYVGSGGSLKVTMLNTGAVTFVGVVTGTVLDIRPVLVWSTGTTAASLLCLW
jgi:hypothetical protein